VALPRLADRSVSAGAADLRRALADPSHRPPVRAGDLLPGRGGQSRSAQPDGTNGRRAEDAWTPGGILVVRRRTAWLPQGREHKARRRRGTVLLREPRPAVGTAFPVMGPKRRYRFAVAISASMKSFSFMPTRPPQAAAAPLTWLRMPSW